MKINKEFKEIWVKALRSNKYTQEKYNLKTNNSYCCLGVACNIAIEQKKVLGYWDEYDYFVETNESGDKLEEEFDLLPDAVQKYIGINDSDLYVVDFPKKYSNLAKKYNLNEDFSYYSLATLNDAGLTFEEIANIIEKEF